MGKKRAHLLHIYNAGVNLAWAQVFMQHAIAQGSYTVNDIKIKLDGAMAEARAAGFFNALDSTIGEAQRRLNSSGISSHTLAAISAALQNFQGQLSGHYCDAQC